MNSMSEKETESKTGQNNTLNMKQRRGKNFYKKVSSAKKERKKERKKTISPNDNNNNYDNRLAFSISENIFFCVNEILSLFTCF